MLSLRNSTLEEENPKVVTAVDSNNLCSGKKDAKQHVSTGEKVLQGLKKEHPLPGVVLGSKIFLLHSPTRVSALPKVA